MRFQTLDEWLSWQESLHPSEIDLGLDRIRAVLHRLGHQQLDCPVITVAGTNGKGSSVAMLEAIYLAAGYRVGSRLRDQMHFRRGNNEDNNSENDERGGLRDLAVSRSPARLGTPGGGE